MNHLFIFISILFFGCSDVPTSTTKVEANTLSTPTKTEVSKITVDSLLLTADSVIIASHESTNYPIRDTATGVLEAPKLVINGKPNWEIIHEKKVLSQKNRSTLRNLLLAKAIDDEEDAVTLCFQPRHAVFLYKGGKLSYIDFCFECVGFARSSDMAYDNLKFDNEKWNNLRLFFINEGFRYRLK